jgi:hypothetical protein
MMLLLQNSPEVEVFVDISQMERNKAHMWITLETLKTAARDGASFLTFFR